MRYAMAACECVCTVAMGMEIKITMKAAAENKCS